MLPWTHGQLFCVHIPHAAIVGVYHRVPPLIFFNALALKHTPWFLLGWGLSSGKALHMVGKHSTTELHTPGLLWLLWAIITASNNFLGFTPTLLSPERPHETLFNKIPALRGEGSSVFSWFIHKLSVLIFSIGPPYLQFKLKYFNLKNTKYLKNLIYVHYIYKRLSWSTIHSKGVFMWTHHTRWRPKLGSDQSII